MTVGTSPVNLNLLVRKRAFPAPTDSNDAIIVDFDFIVYLDVFVIFFHIISISINTVTDAGTIRDVVQTIIMMTTLTITMMLERQ